MPVLALSSIARSRRVASRPRAPCAAVFAALLVGLVPMAAPHAESVTVAAAANFLDVLAKLEAGFESATAHEMVVVSASTGQLHAQIVNGAPFDVLLAADQRRPRLLVDEGHGVAATRFTYAVGRLVLWTRVPSLRQALTLDVLRGHRFRWLAIANPDVAPYGAAARQTLESLGLWEKLEPRIARGQNVGQAFVMAESGNAELGLVALSQALAHEGPAAHVVVPPELHEPIRQDAIVLERARANPAAAAFIEYLRGPAAAAVIERAGYSVGR